LKLLRNYDQIKLKQVLVFDEKGKLDQYLGEKPVAEKRAKKKKKTQPAH